MTMLGVGGMPAWACAYGVPCNSLEALWEALDGSYNAAAACPVDLSFLDPVTPLPPRQWVPFSSLELSEALATCAKNSAPGPDHVSWAHLKFWCHSSRVTLLFTRMPFSGPLALAFQGVPVGHHTEAREA
jgi:hypothetical protein